MKLSPSAYAWIKSLIIVSIGTMFLGMGMYYFKARYEEVVVDQRQIVMRVANQLDLYFNGRLLALQFVVAETDVKMLDSSAMRRHLVQAVKLLGLSNAAVINREGNIVAIAEDDRPFAEFATKMKDSSAFSGHPVISNISMLPGGSGTYISLQVPIYSQNGLVVGVFVASVPMKEVANVIAAQPMTADAYVFVMDDKIHLMYHPLLENNVDSSGQNSRHYAPSLFQKKTGDLLLRSVYDEIDELNVYTVMEGTKWRIVAAMPVGRVYSTILRNSLPDLVIFVLLLVCIALMSRTLAQAKRYQQDRETLRLQRLSSVNQLASGIAHEIRNPLTSIKGFIQLMAMKPGQPPAANYLEIILAEIDRIEKLISEFQMLSKPLKPIPFQKVDLTQILNDVVMLMESQAISKNVDLKFSVKKNSVRWPFGPDAYCVSGDVAQLKQVWINLLRNALEAVEKGGKVRVILLRQENQVIVIIKDNGMGMTPEVMAKLGTAFYTTKENGTGLGLSMCYNIVHNHGGKMEVDSKPGEGTRFTVLLPCVKKAVRINRKKGIAG